MSLYDVVNVGKRTGQVKLWRNQLDYRSVGSFAPPVRNAKSYDIVMREGGYVHVRALTITGWDDEGPTPDVPAFDKWGAELVDAETNTGEVGAAIAEFIGESSGYFYDWPKKGNE